MLVEKEQVKAMIDYSNIEIHKLVDEVAIKRNQPAINHWIDQFYKILKANAEHLKPKHNSRKNQSAGIIRPSELIKSLTDEDKKELKQLLSKYAD